MAVLLKEAAPAADAANDGPGPAAEDLVPPFDVVTYAGPITVEGYERLSALLEARQKSRQVMVVLDTPGGDPHAAFRIARALGAHYERVEALVPRYCKSAGTLVILGASVLHMDDLGELGPLDMQVPRANESTGQGSALEFSETLGALWPQQLQRLPESMEALKAQGLPLERAALAAAHFVGGIYQPISEQVDPVNLVAMSRAMSVASAYGERLALKGQNITPTGVWQLVYSYPSHSFVIDRKEAQRLFFDVRAPKGTVEQIARWCRIQTARWAALESPSIEIHSFPFLTLEVSHAEEDSPSLGVDGSPSQDAHERAGLLR